MTIVVRNDLTELERVGQAVAAFWTENGLPAELEGDVNLALEEMLSNVMLHGYPDGMEHEITVTLDRDGGALRVSIEDDGLAFNPLEAPAADLSGPLEQRPIGGLGIFLVRNLMDKLEYARRSERNLLVMTKRL
jgi:anti-sigma regulatory factor (Ser/Thr protein kinase)